MYNASWFGNVRVDIMHLKDDNIMSCTGYEREKEISVMNKGIIICTTEPECRPIPSLKL